MKRKTEARKYEQANPVQLRPNAKDQQLLEKLRDHNWRLTKGRITDAGIIRLALEALAEKQELI